ncbi:subclass B1 metallo-beta-lactamase [Nannocystaceae bacterium ST9]
MRRFAFGFAFVFVSMLAGCKPATSESPESSSDRAASSACTLGEVETIDDALELRCIAEHVWLFTALGETDSYGTMPANGLAIVSPRGTLLVDTAWTTAQGQQLLDWARTRGAPVHAAIVTHFHYDRLGGIAALLDAGLPVFASAATIELARAQQAELDHLRVPDRELHTGSLAEVEWLAPGPGHSPDNIVVWHAESRTLFGGCFVKDAAATSLGNLSDADVEAWPGSLERTREAFSQAAIVVPGHGDAGTLDLLAHTLALLDAERSKPVAD